MAVKTGNSGRHFAGKLDSIAPSNPARALADLTSATIELGKRLDSLKQRNVALEPTIARIKERSTHDRKTKNSG